MRTLILFLGFLLISNLSYSQDKRIPELDRQNTRNDSLCVIVDDTSSLDSARFMTLSVLNPLIDELTLDNTVQDKDVSYVRVNISGTEYRIPLRRANPDIHDLSTGSSISTLDYLTYNTASSDKRILYGTFLTDLVAEGTFTSSVNSRINTVVTESYVINLLQYDTTFSFTYGTPTRDGSITLTRYGDQVSGYITLDYGETTNAIYTTSNGLAGTFLPEVNTIVINESGFNVIFYSDGTIKLKDTRSGDYSSGYEDGSTDMNYSVSYITN